MSTKDIVGKFAEINTDAYVEYDVPMGSTVVVAGSGFAPTDDDDNYKLLFVVSKFENGKAQDHGITVARKHLNVFSDEKCKELQEQLEKNFPANNEEVIPPKSEQH